MGLLPLPNSFARTRAGLHRVAEELVAPARKPENEIALRATSGGFGTPQFEFEGASHQVRVEGVELVHERDGEVRRTTIASIAEAAPLLTPLLGEPLPADTEPLELDLAAATRLAGLYEFAARSLERFRHQLGPAEAASELNLWPEHFDIAFEAGDEAGRRRANYGVSPGDEQHPEPYVYVGPWAGRPVGEVWNATGFPGAELSYAELVEAEEPEALALEFLERRLAALAG